MARPTPNITLGDMWIKSATPSVKAGKVDLRGADTGGTTHRLRDHQAPAKVSGGCSTTLAARQGQGAHGGGRDTVTADLKRGAYELVCFMPGHYAAGQHIPFTVD